MSTVDLLPICTIQPDFPDVLNDVRNGAVPEDTFWLSCYKDGEPSVHAKVHANLDERDRDLVVLRPDKDVDIAAADGRIDPRRTLYTARCPTLGMPDTTLLLPTQAYANPSLSDPRKAPTITAFALAPDMSQFATGHADGSISLLPIPPSSSSAPSPRPYAHAKPHLSSLTSLQFFPSSRVLLSASLDFTLVILSAEPPATPQSQPQRLSPVRTLKGHTRAITSTAIVSRGRTIVSGAKDGTIRLWDVPSSSQIRALVAGGTHTPVMALSLGQRPLSTPNGDISHPEAQGSDIDEREVDTAEKVVFAALHDGTLEAHDLRTKQAVLRVRPRIAPGTSVSPLEAVAYDDARGTVATGDARGVVRIYDVRALSSTTSGETAKELGTVRRNDASIEDLAWLPPGDGRDSDTPTLAIATSDGLPYLLHVGPDRLGVYAELVGVDCEPVFCIKTVGREVWTAAGDGVVRRHVL